MSTQMTEEEGGTNSYSLSLSGLTLIITQPHSSEIGSYDQSKGGLERSEGAGWTHLSNGDSGLRAHPVHAISGAQPAH